MGSHAACIHILGIDRGLSRNRPMHRDRSKKGCFAMQQRQATWLLALDAWVNRGESGINQNPRSQLARLYTGFDKVGIVIPIYSLVPWINMGGTRPHFPSSRSQQINRQSVDGRQSMYIESNRSGGFAFGIDLGACPGVVCPLFFSIISLTYPSSSESRCMHACVHWHE